ncbi:head-tail connector protein [Streptococcus suis]
MVVTLDEVKQYLRVDFSEDDALIRSLIASSERLCASILRLEHLSLLPQQEETKTAVLYSVAYLYEHREEANHNELMLTLRSLLFGLRKAEF